MGVLSTGRPLTWNEIVPYRSILKNHALNDLITILNKHRHRTNDAFLWGDEIEYSLLRFDHKTKRVQLLLKADEILSKFNQLDSNELSSIMFHAEDCNFVIEGIPSIPYGSFFFHYNRVESNMKLRREQVEKFLDKNEYILTISAFPRLGCDRCTYPEYKSDPENSFEHSICCSDHYKTPNYPRTMFLNQNVIERRQSKVSVNVPILKDLNTSNPFRDDFSSYGVSNWKDYVNNNLQDNYIHLDSSSVGWGCCCLQVTLQAQSFDESLHLYDQLIPLTAIFLSLSTSCPIWRGYLSNVDSRWNVLSSTTDDRTKEEIEKNLLNTSRYSSVPCYLSDSSDIYNDTNLNIDQEVYQILIQNNCPSTVAKHFAHLFLRDPLYVTDEQVHPKENPSNKFAFENQNSMVWNSLRFKPPVSEDSASLGWRIEFRPMELQITDFENAALSVFLTLLTRAILSYNIDLRMPISLVNENMERAQMKNNIQIKKFHFPTQIFHDRNCQKHETREMSMDEIINGSTNFIGLKSLVVNYLNSFEDIDTSTRQTMDNYLQFISQRANGTILTNAMWIREYVKNHPLYKHDSIVNEQIQYDLMWLIQQIANQKQSLPNTQPSYNKL
ncbi:unnamed protein product [Adineta steineri]|uniref:Glutamate--cysteine ligase n=1 Tax=Adineta steineri TaxID=433720 RepID=A0A818M5N3_9BILA|nr:unnamed protein product [Adineta steineri]CAF3582937.1 unnamed protein product [Adineta steineri]